MRKKEMNQPVHEFEDSAFVAFLVLRGHQYIPVMKQNGRVAFEVAGDITGDVEAYYLNHPVGVREYGQVLKSIRSSIFNMKSMR